MKGVVGIVCVSSLESKKERRAREEQLKEDEREAVVVANKCHRTQHSRPKQAECVWLPDDDDDDKNPNSE